MKKKALIGMSTGELRALAQEESLPPYRGAQIAEWIYRRGARSFEDMGNLPKTLRAILAGKYEIGRSEIVAARHSKDGTMKLLLELGDGARIETVGLPYADRFSCCVSTQAGCPIGCVFCASGRDGLVRDLSHGEIVEQVLAVQETEHAGRRIDHVVIMGMGEPLMNYDATLRAVRLLNEEVGIGMRHITVSTAGYVPGILKLAEERLQLTLAVSLHAPTDELRRKLVPGLKWSVAEIMDACREFVDKTGRRVTFEYCLLDGVNDGEAEAHRLAELLSGLNCHVNLIRYNPVPDLPFRAPAREQTRVFRDILESSGIRVTQRMQRGSDIEAACGQLRRRMDGRETG